MNNNLSIGNHVIFNFEFNSQVFSRKAVVVDKYIIENEVPRIQIGCIFGLTSNKEAYVLETEKLERFVILEDLLDYTILQEKVYKKLNYTKLKIGSKVKIYDEVYGIYKIDEDLVDTIGNILMIYTNELGIKMAVIDAKKIEIPLVNCIAL